MGMFDWLFGGDEEGDSGFSVYNKPPYTGQRPWMPSDIGWGTEAISPLAKQYLSQIMQMAKGEGQVGFDPRYTAMKKQNIEGDLAEQRRRDTEQMQGQASGQGLRGGIPMSIGQRYMTDWQRNRQNSLNNLDIADLEARREDTNKAIYAQPELANQASDMQAKRSIFDLQEYNDTLPTLIENGQRESSFPDLLSLGMSLFGGSKKKSLADALASLNSGSSNVNKSIGSTNIANNISPSVLAAFGRIA